MEEHTKDGDPECNFFTGYFFSNAIRKQTCQAHHYSAKKANGKKAFPKNFNDYGKIQKGNRRFKVPKLGIGQISIDPGLSHKDESAFISIHIIPKKERETDKNGHHDQNKKDHFPVQIFIP